MRFQYQEPALGIMKTSEFPDTKFYDIPCKCSNEEHTITMEIDKEDNEVSVITYLTLYTDWWSGPVDPDAAFNNYSVFWFKINYVSRKWINAVAHRLRITKDVWFNGRVSYQHSLLMTPQQAYNYAQTILKEIKD